MEEEGDKVNTWAGHRLNKDVLKEKEIGEGAKEWASADGGSDGKIVAPLDDILDGNIVQLDDIFFSHQITSGDQYACSWLSPGPSG